MLGTYENQPNHIHLSRAVGKVGCVEMLWEQPMLLDFTTCSTKKSSTVVQGGKAYCQKKSASKNDQNTSDTKS